MKCYERRAFPLHVILHVHALRSACFSALVSLLPVQGHTDTSKLPQGRYPSVLQSPEVWGWQCYASPLLPCSIVGARGPVGPLCPVYWPRGTGGVRREVLPGACSLVVLELPLLPVLPGLSHSFADQRVFAAQTCISPPDGTQSSSVGGGLPEALTKLASSRCCMELFSLEQSTGVEEVGCPWAAHPWVPGAHRHDIRDFLCLSACFCGCCALKWYKQMYRQASALKRELLVSWSLRIICPGTTDAWDQCFSCDT